MARMKNFEKEMTSMEWVTIVMFALELVDTRGIVEMCPTLMADVYDTFRFQFEKLNCDQPAYGATLIGDLQRVKYELNELVNDLTVKMEMAESLREIGVLGYRLEKAQYAIILVQVLDEIITDKMLELLGN